MEESSNIVLQLRVRIQRTKDECNHLEKQIQETEQLLINDQVRIDGIGVMYRNDILNL